jgi:hypothetical protein
MHCLKGSYLGSVSQAFAPPLSALRSELIRTSFRAISTAASLSSVGRASLPLTYTSPPTSVSSISLLRGFHSASPKVRRTSPMWGAFSITS